MKRRDAARIIALNARGEVLLFQYAWSDGRRFWATPGGGLEPGESYEAAAAREAAEELGVDGATLVRAWERVTEFVFGTELLQQHEQYFLLAFEAADLPDRVIDFHREEGIHAVRWWSVESLAATLDVIFPEDLHDRLVSLGRMSVDTEEDQRRYPSHVAGAPMSLTR